MAGRFASTTASRRRDIDHGALSEFALISQLEDGINDAAHSDLDVLLSGGTGRLRRLLARLIHRRWARGGDPFVVVPPHELERVLPGRRGAGDHAGAAGSGRAPAGVAFVEDIGSLRAAAQTRLLRMLDQRAAQRRQGETRVAPRLILGTGPSLLDRVDSGHFSRELFYRLNTIHLTLPPGTSASDHDS